MYLTKMKLFCILFIVIGIVAIITSTYLVSRLWYKTNGVFVCFNLCCGVSEETPQSILLSSLLNVDDENIVPVAAPNLANNLTPASVVPVNIEPVK